MEELTPFEKQREENIKANKKLLEELGLPEKEALIRRKAEQGDRKRRRSGSPQMPARKSCRLAEQAAKKNKDGQSRSVSLEPVKEESPRLSSEQQLKAAKVFGEIPGVPVGTWGKGRQHFHDNLVHRGLVQGIFGNPEEGAFSVAVSGGYDDNEDSGHAFVYCGEGGRDLNHQGKKKRSLRTAPQSSTQILSKGNAALEKSVETGKPVRVIRGYKGKWAGAPLEGYRYDGLYKVKSSWEEEGKAGFGVYRYEFIRLPGQLPIDINAGPGSRLSIDPTNLLGSPESSQ